MSTPNQNSGPDHTGITQDLENIVAAVRAADPEKRAAIAARIAELHTSTQQEVAITTAPEAIATRTPEQIELINNIANQYESSVATWTKLNIPTEGIQTKQEITAWLNSLPANTLENLAAYGEVRLKFIPPVKTLELLKAIKGRSHWDEGWQDVGAKEWEFGLTTDKKDMPLDPNIYYINGVDKNDGTRKNEVMVDLYEKKYQEQGMDLMPQKAYVPSAADALAQGKVLDHNFYTLFKCREGTVRLPSAGWRYGRVELSWFGGSHVGSPLGDLRCRPWVRGEKV